MSVRTTKDRSVLAGWNDTEVLIDLLLIAQSALVRDASELSQVRAVNAAIVCLALARRASDLIDSLRVELENDRESLLEQ